MPMIDAILGEYDAEAANTRKMMERYPADKAAWKPHDKSFSMQGLAAHVATLPSFAKSIATTDALNMKAGDYVPFVPKTREELLARFEQETADTRAALAKLTDADMAKPWSFSWEGKKMFEMPRGVALRRMCFNHLIHHRGQLTVYYRENGVPLPGMYGPTADEKF